MLLLTFYFVLSAFAAECNAEGTTKNNCVVDNCEMVETVEICVQCMANFVPINGQCQAKADVTDKCTDADGTNAADQTCKKCKGQTFMYKGGCYDKEGAPGNAICKTSGDIEGVCNECQDGYFKNAGNLATSDSCSPCVINCVKCSAAGNNKCSKCVEGYFVGAANDSEGQCIKCDNTVGTDSYNGITGCAKCTKPASPGTVTCDECTSDYLKTDAGTTSCVQKEQCNGGYFPNDNVDGKKQCIPCGTADHGGVAGCTACSPLQPASMVTTVLVKCSACAPNSKPNVAGTGCFTCSIDGCDNCSENGVCEKCGNAKKVSPGKNSCVEQCPENSIEKESVCVCNSGYGPDSAGTGCVTVSTNLSTGAIAGISVAVIVVVGGLVGFLCWWFICRSKA